MLRDLSESDDAFWSLWSDSVVSEAKGSEDKRVMTLGSTTHNEPMSDSTSSIVEVVSESDATESEVVRLLAARIPPELFDVILFYVNVHCVSQRYWPKPTGNDLERDREDSSRKDIWTDLKRCSLVCLFWANLCRQYMFAEKTLCIMCYEDAAIFREYVARGSARLTSVYQFIGKLRVRQDYESRRSFIHLLYLPAIQNKLEWLVIRGPVPNGFVAAKLDTPHWGIPPSMVVPGSFLRKSIAMENIHLPSFYHFTKYMRHFSCATDITFTGTTWGGRSLHVLSHASSMDVCDRRPHSMKIRADKCTNSVHLALTALMLNPNCPLHRLSEEERAWMTKFMMLLWGGKKDTGVYMEFDVSKQTTTMCLDPFHFVFEEALSTDQGASTLNVVGVHAHIWRDVVYGSDKLPVYFDALVHHAQSHPALRSFVLLFESLDHLQGYMASFVQVPLLATETIKFVLAYEERGNSRTVGVDPVTLELNGCVWANRPDWLDVRCQWNEEILRRELKKAR